MNENIKIFIEKTNYPSGSSTYELCLATRNHYIFYREIEDYEYDDLVDAGVEVVEVDFKPKEKEDVEPGLFDDVALATIQSLERNAQNALRETLERGSPMLGALAERDA